MKYPFKASYWAAFMPFKCVMNLETFGHERGHCAIKTPSKFQNSKLVSVKTAYIEAGLQKTAACGMYHYTTE